MQRAPARGGRRAGWKPAIPGKSSLSVKQALDSKARREKGRLEACDPRKVSFSVKQGLGLKGAG